MTYQQRYARYTDEALGVTYLESYKDWLKTSHSQERSRHEYGTLAALELGKANAAALQQLVPAWRQLADDCTRKSALDTSNKTVIVMRAYENYTWGEDDILNVRAMIVEASLKSAEPMDVRILLEVHDDRWAIASSERHRSYILSQSVPREFWDITELWNEGQMGSLYPALPGKFLNRMAAESSYRSCFMPTQNFALDHPEYSFVWNWEMDSRFTGDYADLFHGASNFARGERDDEELGRYKHWLMEQVPASVAEWATSKTISEGVGKEPDLIVFNPIFDPRQSGWYWEYDIQNYPEGRKTDRRASIGRNIRLSRALLHAMSTLNAEEKKSAHCESWPATVVLHSNQAIWQNANVYQARATSYLKQKMKAVYAPHPIYFGHHHSPSELYKMLSRSDFYKKANEKVMRDSSFYYDGGHAKRLYVEWKQLESTCMAPALLHPVKSMY
ncbi:hypothetical protein CBS101457_002555 [Exobasidium rhododendri]|nr:hypothetical protein CBS101457_002555 [Exobasidium rhododendri]